MPRILITGISGFVGGFFSDYLRTHRPDFQIHGISRSKPSWDFIPYRDILIKNIVFSPRKSDGHTERTISH